MKNKVKKWLFIWFVGFVALLVLSFMNHWEVVVDYMNALLNEIIGYFILLCVVGISIVMIIAMIWGSIIGFLRLIFPTHYRDYDHRRHQDDYWL